MRVIPKAANDMMDVGRLQGFDVSVTLFLHCSPLDFTYDKNILENLFSCTKERRIKEE